MADFFNMVLKCSLKLETWSYTTTIGKSPKINPQLCSSQLIKNSAFLASTDSTIVRIDILKGKIGRINAIV